MLPDELDKRLDSLERYERRTMSRRKGALSARYYLALPTLLPKTRAEKLATQVAAPSDDTMREISKYRRRFSREFKVESVKLVTEREVSVAQVARTWMS
jgi:hypothetical protein